MEPEDSTKYTSSESSATLSSLTATFFARSPEVVARELLGQRLIRRLSGQLLIGRIVEAEAYAGTADSTSHAFRGPTGRAGVMFGPPGRAYVYLIYGMHSCLNVVAHCAGEVGAVLIRALAPEQGTAEMQRISGQRDPRLITSGPGRLCRAMQIDRGFTGQTLLDPTTNLWLAAGPPPPPTEIEVTARVGVVGTPEDMALPWRFSIRHDPHVSAKHRRP